MPYTVVTYPPSLYFTFFYSVDYGAVDFFADYGSAVGGVDEVEVNVSQVTFLEAAFYGGAGGGVGDVVAEFGGEEDGRAWSGSCG